LRSGGHRHWGWHSGLRWFGFKARRSDDRDFFKHYFTEIVNNKVPYARMARRARCRRAQRAATGPRSGREANGHGEDNSAAASDIGGGRQVRFLAALAPLQSEPGLARLG
jgi:hypothetical protein